MTLTAAALDAAHGPEGRAAHDRASLLTPIAKAFSTDIANEVASNEAHTDGIAQRFHTPGDALQSIRIAR